MEYCQYNDDYTCQICGISKKFLDDVCPGLGDYLLLEIDHILSVKQGGSGDDINNLQTLCWRCNRTKSAKKTNQDVAAKITYGVSKLKCNDKDASAFIYPKSAWLKYCSFSAPDDVINTVVNAFQINRLTAEKIVERVLPDGMCTPDKIKLLVNIFCQLIDEGRI